MARGDTLTSWRLWIARAAWLLALVVVILTLSNLWPENYGTTYGEWVVSNSRSAVIEFTRYSAFVRFVTVVESAAALTALAVGLLIFARKSRSAMGIFVSAFLILTSPWLLSSNMDVWRLPPWFPFAGVVLPLQQIATLGALMLFLYIFPDGRFSPPWARWPALVAPLSFAAFSATAFLSGPSSTWVSDAVWFAFAAPFMLSIVCAGVLQVHRYRRVADPVQRQQMKWVVFGLGYWVIALVFISFLGGLLTDSPWVALVGLLAMLSAQLLIPVTIGVAVLRYRLWDIDLWIRRTLVYGGLTFAVLALYAALIGGLAFALQGRIEPPFAVLATALVALLALPLRDRLQRGVNRLLYGERDDPMALLTRLGNSLEAAAAPADALPAVAASITHALRLPYTAVTLRDGETYTVAAQHGVRPEAGIEVVPMMYGQEAVGQILAARRAVDEPLMEADHRVLGQIARQAAGGLAAARLTAELQRSRERLVLAREEERRRLHRDLHDGLGPHLAGLALMADAAANRLPGDPTAAGQLLREIKTQAQSAVGDIRRLVYELRPLPLDQLGLAPALREYAASLSAAGPMEVRVESEDLPPLPAATEVAAYRIALEALTNAVRHGAARHCEVRLAANGSLRLEVVDDGRGIGEGGREGVGLRSMRERAEELGGAFCIESLPEGGTRILAELPLR